MATDVSQRAVAPTDRPQGRAAVTAALKQAALELLAEQGISFSTREVAARANVNHGLIHRHFGSKRELLSAALAERNAALEELADDASPFDLNLQGEPPTAVLVARLILDNATELIGDHLTTEAVVAGAARRVDDGGPLSAGERAAVATAISLGWAVFGPYALQAAGVPHSIEATSALQAIVDDLLGYDAP